MTFIPDTYAEAAVQLNTPGPAGPSYNIFGMFNAGDLSAVAIGAALVPILSNTSGYRGLVNDSSTIVDVTVRANRGAAFPEIATTTVNVAGGLTGSPESPQVAILMQKVSGVTGRANRGRMYFPAPPESQTDGGGNYLAGVVAGYQARADQFESDLNLAGLPMVILHDNPALTPTPVLSFSISSTVATQRRRVR